MNIKEIHNHSLLVIQCQNSIFFHFECSKEKESCIFPFVQQWFIIFSGIEIEINSGYGYNVHEARIYFMCLNLQDK